MNGLWQKLQWGMVGFTCAFVIVGVQLLWRIFDEQVASQVVRAQVILRIDALEEQMDVARDETIGLIKHEHR